MAALAIFVVKPAILEFPAKPATAEPHSRGRPSAGNPDPETDRSAEMIEAEQGRMVA